MIKDINIRLHPHQAADTREILRLATAKAGMPPGTSPNDWRVVRKSVDARKKPVVIDMTVRLAWADDTSAAGDFTPAAFAPVGPDAPCAVIVGAGPAGLFAALKAISLGIRPIVVERGKDVDTRRLDLAGMSRSGTVNPDSNYCFGEGGAGAYSDGKLYTRSKKRGSNREVLSLLVQHGADSSILVDAHPHIGSDKLPGIIKAIRNTITANGGIVKFRTKAISLVTEEGRAVGVTTESGEELRGAGVVLATGHSARDTIRGLHDAGVAMSPKGIAVGVRLEHPQHLIDCLQYHSHEGRGKYLPAAEYSFVTQCGDRGVYSFCMCPGGVVVPSASAEGESAVNGMSASARSGRWANSGMVVELHPGDLFPDTAGSPLEMLEVQERIEKTFHQASGGSLKAPAQRMEDFVEGCRSETLPPTSYAPGIFPGDFNTLLPPFITTRLAQGFREFGRKSKGFLTNEAVMIGLESRTSSPVRIERDPATLQSISIPGLFPAGEGAGYAGGIVSAAIDGMRCMDALATQVAGNVSQQQSTP